MSFRDLWRRRRSYVQRQCTHPLRAVSRIGGDAIIHSGWKRGVCGECGLWLDDVPETTPSGDPRG